MPSEAFVGRVGGLAVVFGVGAAATGLWGTGLAWADDSPAPDAAPAAEKAETPAVPKDRAEHRLPRNIVTGLADLGQHVSANTATAARAGTYQRSRGPDSAPTKPTRKRTAAPESAVAEVQHDSPPSETPSNRRAFDAVKRLADAAAPEEQPPHLASLRAVSTPTPPVVTPDAPEPTPRVIAVVNRLVSGVADAVLPQDAATTTPGAPGDAPLTWALLAFARREFEAAVRLPSPTDKPAAPQTRSETVVAESAEPEKRTLVLTAFPAEADAILARTTLDDDPVVVVDGHHYYRGTLGGKKVIVAMTGIGMENAADTTETALTYFTPESGTSIEAVVFAGVAGGSGRTEIGDVAVPRRWTSDGGATWHEVDPGMLEAASELTVDLESTDTIADPACRICGPLARLRLIDLNREPDLHVGGDGSTDDNNNGAKFPAIPFGGAIFGPQPLAAPDFSPLFTGNFFEALGPFLVRGVVSNIIGFLTDEPPAVDAVDQETAAAQQIAEAHGVPFLGIRGMSDGPGDPLNLPGYPFTFVVYKQIAADNAAIVTEAFLEDWDGTEA